MKKYGITIFTPTYNRGYILPKLKESLINQDYFDFEWLIIDDGSEDDTNLIVDSWKNEGLPFDICYKKVNNGGKPRAINLACGLARSEWLFIIDSDDELVPNSLGFIASAINEIREDCTFVGVGVLRGHSIVSPLGTVKFSDFVDATNLQRKEYGLTFDCNEAYRISILKKFPFHVWQDERFVPEETVLNEMSLHGYKLRWYDRVCVLSEYLPDGMTKGAWNLIKNNPMGYAMMFNHRLKYAVGYRNIINNVCQFIAMCLYAGHPLYIANCIKPMFALFCFPFGCMLAIRRFLQFKVQ